jgi:hypothetical protein
MMRPPEHTPLPVLSTLPRSKVGLVPDQAPVAALREERQPADVVEMGVADDHRIHVPALQHGNLAVLGDGLSAPLVEAAVDEHAGVLGSELECGPSHISRRPVEVELHPRCSSSRLAGFLVIWEQVSP